ncbi:MAG: hypothetical protein JOZ49_07195, partial [Mycolicibacterium sp.]|nr:hypothetical protein [Mycolicibacterium sp.]
AGNFGFVDAAGNEFTGVTASAAATQATVTAWSSGADPANAVQFFVRNGAVMAGKYNNAEGGIGGSVTTRPTLAGVAPSITAPNLVDFTFDHNVAASTAADFLLYLANANAPGSPIAGIGPVRQMSSNTLEVAFPTATINQSTIGDVSLGAVIDTVGGGKALAAGVDPTGGAALQITGATKKFNTIGSVAVGGQSARAGGYDGPVLEVVHVDNSSSTAAFTFSSPIATATAGAFFLIGAGTAVIPAVGASSIWGDTVVVTFPAGSTFGALAGGVTNPALGNMGGGTLNAPGAALPGPAATDLQGNPTLPGTIAVS